MLSLKKFELVQNLCIKLSPEIAQSCYKNSLSARPQLASFPPQKYLVWWPAVSAKHCRVSQPFLMIFSATLQLFPLSFESKQICDKTTQTKAKSFRIVHILIQAYFQRKVLGENKHLQDTLLLAVHTFDRSWLGREWETEWLGRRMLSPAGRTIGSLLAVLTSCHRVSTSATNGVVSGNSLSRKRPSDLAVYI